MSTMCPREALTYYPHSARRLPLTIFAIRAVDEVDPPSNSGIRILQFNLTRATVDPTRDIGGQGIRNPLRQVKF